MKTKTIFTICLLLLGAMALQAQELERFYNDNEKVASETKAYQNIPEILSFVNEHGEDKMKQEIESNYKQIKLDVLTIVEREIERIKNDPDLQHLVQ